MARSRQRPKIAASSGSKSKPPALPGDTCCFLPQHLRFDLFPKYRCEHDGGGTGNFETVDIFQVHHSAKPMT